MKSALDLKINVTQKSSEKNNNKNGPGSIMRTVSKGSIKSNNSSQNNTNGKYDHVKSKISTFRGGEKRLGSATGMRADIALK